MDISPFAPDIEDLPDTLPVFPLESALLLPWGQLPLNIFEPRYLEMVRDALGTRQRLIGMLLPQQKSLSDFTGITGCAGRITSFSETRDGRYLIVLTGVCRFNTMAHLQTSKAYIHIRPDWNNYLADLKHHDSILSDRGGLQRSVDSFLAARKMRVDWGDLEGFSDEVLVNALCMQLPLLADARQRLLEASLIERVDVLEGYLDMGRVESGAGHVLH